jgi:RNA polymerase sigma-70 factor (ECF subfamily)
LSALYRAHAHELLAYLGRQAGYELALDLLAETFAAALRDHTQFTGGPDGEALAWIYAIARHQLSHHFRRVDAERRALRRVGLAPPGREDERLHRIEQLADVARVRPRLLEELDRLGASHRDAVLLRVVEELPYASVAQALGTSEQTARTRVSRALRQLSAALGDGGRP